MKILNFSCIWDTAALKLLTVLLKVVSGEVPGAGIGSSTAGECLNGELSWGRVPQFSLPVCFSSQGKPCTGSWKVALFGKNSCMCWYTVQVQNVEPGDRVSGRQDLSSGFHSSLRLTKQSSSRDLIWLPFSCVCVSVDWKNWAVGKSQWSYSTISVMLYFGSAGNSSNVGRSLSPAFLLLGTRNIHILQSFNHNNILIGGCHWRAMSLHFFECQRCVSYLHEHICIDFLRSVLIFNFLSLCILGFE